MGVQKSPEWISFCSASETSFDCEEYEHNNECRAIEVIGQNWSSEVVALFLEDWELGRVALSCHMAVDSLCQEMRDTGWESPEPLGCPWSVVAANKHFSQRGRAATVNGRDVVRENKEKKGRNVRDKSL